MTVFRNVMVYLGLGPDEEYEDGYLQEDYEVSHDDHHELARKPAPATSGAFGSQDVDSRAPDEDGSPSAVGAVRPLRPVVDDDDVLDLDAADRAAARTPSFDHAPATAGVGGRTDRPPMSSGLGESRVEPVVRAVPIQRTKPLALVPESFGDAKTIADEFQRSVPVIMNLQGLDRELARRLIDFASGVCYSLDGSMDKIASQVFLLTPKSVEVSDEDMRRIEERGYTR